MIRKRSNLIKKSKKIKIQIHRNIKRISSILIIVVLLIGGFYVLAALNESDQRVEEDFIFNSVDGNEIHLSSYKGKIVILDMWATWCNPCKSQMIELKKIYEQYPREKLEIFSVDVDTSETFQQIQDFKDSFKEQADIDLNWIFGKDDGSIRKKYMMREGGIPTLCIFDQEGKLYYQYEGAEDAATLTQKIGDLLK
jgi:cytochrome c biogenesis protein CcmG, thiol:disulfide interchange protein DsbE